MIQEIVDSKRCFGCGACRSVCPVSAIEMKKDRAGFPVPVVDTEACLGCGACRNVCPAGKPVPETENRFFGVKVRDERRLQSTSGGVFRVLAEEVLSAGGTVFGAGFDDDLRLSYMAVRTAEELGKLLGTKYIQADPGDIFFVLKEELEKKLPVLFCGSPCMTHAVKTFLEDSMGHLPEKLLLADHICFGVPAPGLWEQYKAYLENQIGGRMTDAIFRTKKKADSAHTVVYGFEKEGKREEITMPFGEDPWLRMYSRGITLRDSCYQCPYCTESRVTDLTLGDFWGIENVRKDFDDGYGVSLVITHTKKGEEALSVVLSQTEYFETDAGSASQPRLRECTKPTILRKVYAAEVERNGIENVSMEMLIKKYGH